MSRAEEAGDDGSFFVELHGPSVTIDDVVRVGEATKELLAEVAHEMGVEGVEWQIASVQFKCDGCGLTRPARPRPDEGWTYSDGDDLCPECSERTDGPIARAKDVPQEALPPVAQSGLPGGADHHRAQQRANAVREDALRRPNGTIARSDVSRYGDDARESTFVPETDR